jgi:hypothetical protein
MAEKKDAHAGGSPLLDKAIPWLAIGLIAIGIVRWMGAPTIIVEGESRRVVGQAVISQPTEPAPAAPKGTQWTQQGKNPLCEGRPKFTNFSCVSPSTGRQSTCYCD